jgi:hypothetical protein
MSKKLGKALQVQKRRDTQSVHMCLYMASFFAAIYVTWRTWHHFLLLFTTVGDRTSYFRFYLLPLVSMGFIFNLIYYGVRAAYLQTS